MDTLWDFPFDPSHQVFFKLYFNVKHTYILRNLNDCQQPLKSPIDIVIQHCLNKCMRVCVQHFNWIQWEFGYERVSISFCVYFFFEYFIDIIHWLFKKNPIFSKFQAKHKQFVHFVKARVWVPNTIQSCLMTLLCSFYHQIFKKKHENMMGRPLKNQF